MECDTVRKDFPDIKFPPCCGACHEDTDMGYGEDLWFVDRDGMSRHVCCAVGNELEGREHYDNLV